MSEGIKKRIGILTYHAADNYGSVLQAYALNYFLSINFSEMCDIINYRSEQQEKMYALYFPYDSVKNVIKNIYIRLVLKSKRVDKITNFSAFRSRNLKMYPSNSTADIAQLELDRYDAIVCGSDQIWNVRVKDFNPVYMLKDVHVPCKLSYAASMGGVDLKLTKEELYQIQENLQDYQGISVRENVAKKMLSQCQLNDISTNIDPTFLVPTELWKEIMSPRIFKEDYIFFYSVDYNEDSVRIAEWYGGELGLPVVYVNTSWRSYFIKGSHMKCAGTSSIEDFLSLLYYAKVVLSGSFHGTAFSLIFNKSFYRIQRKRDQATITDDRVRSLFDTLGVEDREISLENYKDRINDLFGMEYDTVNINIGHARERTKQYFASILSKGENDENRTN